MPGEKPRLYLLHGEDELAIKQFIATLESKMGEPGMASLNTTRLEGGAFSLEELRSTVLAVPFMLPRRLVIVESMLSSLVNEPMREVFIDILEHVPASTALVLVEYHTLPVSERGKEKPHWLQVWAKGAGEKAHIKGFLLPKASDMAKWIQGKARQLGGEFTPEAAELLAGMVGQDTRLASQEIEKLLLFVDFSRAVAPGDVQELTPYAGAPADFALANALRERNQKQALHILHQELSEKDPLVILHSMVALFRRLLMARDVIERGGGEAGVIKELRVSPGYAYHLTNQAQAFSMADLRAIYLKLLEIDVAIKTSQMEGDVALDIFLASFTPQS